MKADALGPLGAANVDPEARDKAKAARERDNVQTAAKQLEAFFLRQLLAETRPKTAGMLGGGFAGDTFKQMLDEAIADKMSAAGGIGMAEMFARQLGSVDPIAHPPVLALPQAQQPLGLARDVRAATEVAAPPPSDTPPFLVPVAGRPSSGYGMRTDPIRGEISNHRGYDIAAREGSEVSAAARGTVVHAGPAGTYGNLVTVRHEDGFETRYAHLSAIDVQVGDVVEAGQGVGKVGATGYATGPHLHFEIRKEGKAIDPAPLLPLNSSSVRTTR